MYFTQTQLQVVLLVINLFPRQAHHTTDTCCGVNEPVTWKRDQPWATFAINRKATTTLSHCVYSNTNLLLTHTSRRYSHWQTIPASSSPQHFMDKHNSRHDFRRTSWRHRRLTAPRVIFWFQNKGAKRIKLNLLYNEESGIYVFIALQWLFNSNW